MNLWETTSPLKWYLVFTEYRHTSLFGASQIMHFLQIEGLWQPWVEQVYQCHFSYSICSPHVYVSHFGSSHNISNFLVILIFVMVICDQWSLMLLVQNDYDSLKSQMMVSIFFPLGMKFFKNLFYWSIVDLQCCVNFCRMAKWLTYTYIHSFSYPFLLWFITGYWI